MSIEYTIDIQLTELGFPDILQPQETPVRETSRRSTADGSFSPSPTPTSLSSTRKQRLLVRGQESVDGEGAGTAKQTSEQTTGLSPVLESSPRKTLNPAHSLQDDQSGKETAVSEASKPTADDATAELESTDEPQLMAAEEEEGQKINGARDAEKEGSAEVERHVEDDSDDSDVSEVYEEEEVDEEDDDEEEEGLDDGMTHYSTYIQTYSSLMLTVCMKHQHFCLSSSLLMP